MKKNTIGILSAMFVFGAVGSCFANANPYADVPAGDWSYEAVSGLVHQGMVRGYSDNNFDKNQILTRNEMAVLIAKALSKENQADAATQGTIDQLVSEYAKELTAIGVENEKLSALTKPAAPSVAKTDSKWDRLTFSGSGRLRFDGGYTGGKTAARPNNRGSYTPNSHINLDINYAYAVNDDWLIKGESEYGRQMNYGGENQTLQNSVFEQLYLTGPIGRGLTIKAGRYSAFSPLGLVYDDKVTGGQVKYATKNFAVTLEAGKATPTDDDTSTTIIDGNTYSYSSQNYQAALFDVPMNKTKLQAGFYHIGGNLNQSQTPEQYVNYYTFGITSQLAENLRLDAGYAKADVDKTYTAASVASTSNSAYLLKFTYRNADLTKPGSFDIFAMYRKSPMLASYSNTDDWVKNVQGFRIGTDYVITKNMGLTAWYTFGKDVDTDEVNNMYRMQWNFLI